MVNGLKNWKKVPNFRQIRGCFTITGKAFLLTPYLIEYSKSKVIEELLGTCITYLFEFGFYTHP